MNVTLKLKLGEYQLIELRRLAGEAQTDVAGIVAGIVTMYLDNKIKAVKADPKQEALVRAVVAAVGIYEGRNLGASEVEVVKRGGRGGRMGRPPTLTQEQTRIAKELRDRGMTFSGIAQSFGVGEWVIRGACGRRVRGAN